MGVYSDTGGDPGGGMSPTLFNIVVGKVVRQWPEGTCDLEVAHHGLVCKIGERGVKIYSDDERIMGRFRKYLRSWWRYLRG